MINLVFVLTLLAAILLVTGVESGRFYGTVVGENRAKWMASLHRSKDDVSVQGEWNLRTSWYGVGVLYNNYAGISFPSSPLPFLLLGKLKWGQCNISVKGPATVWGMCVHSSWKKYFPEENSYNYPLNQLNFQRISYINPALENRLCGYLRKNFSWKKIDQRLYARSLEKFAISMFLWNSLKPSWNNLSTILA